MNLPHISTCTASRPHIHSCLCSTPNRKPERLDGGETMSEQHLGLRSIKVMIKPDQWRFQHLSYFHHQVWSASDSRQGFHGFPLFSDRWCVVSQLEPSSYLSQFHGFHINGMQDCVSFHILWHQRPRSSSYPATALWFCKWL